MIVAGELEQPRMKPNRGARAFEHGAAQIVVDQGARDALKRRKGLDVAAQKLSSVWSTVKSAKTAREYESTITKPESGRTPRPIRIDPKAPQSTCASSAASVVSRR